MRILQGIDARQPKGGHLICANLGLTSLQDQRHLKKALVNSPQWLSVGSLKHGATLTSQRLLDAHSWHLSHQK